MFRKTLQKQFNKKWGCKKGTINLQIHVDRQTIIDFYEDNGIPIDKSKLTDKVMLKVAGWVRSLILTTSIDKFGIPVLQENGVIPKHF